MLSSRPKRPAGRNRRPSPIFSSDFVGRKWERCTDPVGVEFPTESIKASLLKIPSDYRLKGSFKQEISLFLKFCYTFLVTPEEKKLLEHVAVLSEENNQILRGIRRSNRWGTAFKVFYWIIILAISFGAYLYIQPYIEKLTAAYQSVSGKVSTVSNVGNEASSFQNFFKSFSK